jgi:arylsulfatase A-like enzyme
VNRREFLAGGAGLALAGLLPGAPGCARGPRVRNLLFVVIEDWNANAAGSYGSPIVRTPHFDALAASGVRFEHAYCQSPICAPSRASFLTGLRPATAGVKRNDEHLDDSVPPGTQSLPEVFHAAGFYTAGVGKLLHPMDRPNLRLHAFDRLELGEIPPDYAGTTARGAQEKPIFDIPKAVLNEVYGDSGETEEQSLDGQRARVTAEILRERAGHDAPFLLALGLLRPHLPWLVPKPFLELYDPATLPLPPAPRGLDYGVPDVALRFRENWSLFTDRDPTPQEIRSVLAAYYACVSFMDAQLGIVLDALEASGLAAETAVVVCADHGFHLGDHGLWGKSTLFESSTRVPLVVRVPGAAGNGQRCDALVELVDLLPTLCELVGVPPRPDFEGTSFAPLVDDPSRPWKRAAFSTCFLGGSVTGYGVRSAQHRWSEWVFPNGRRVMELYDLAADPWEQTNLIQSPAVADIAKQHEAWLRAGWRSVAPVV